MKRTVADLKESYIPETINTGPNDPRLLKILNMATERLMNRGDFVGVTAKIRICATGPCIVWPRQVGRVEKLAICNESMFMQTQWYEFLDFGPGLELVNMQCTVQVIDDGFVSTISGIQGTAKYLKVYAFVAEDEDAEVNAQGYDENNQWIRTQDEEGAWRNGEDIPVTLATATSTKLFGSAPTSFKKTRTNGTVRIFSLNTEDLTEILLAEMQYDETVSNYRRSRITNWDRVRRSCCGCDDRVTVTAIVKLAYAPVAQDEDWLLIGNMPAMLMAMQAEQKFARNLGSEGEGYLNAAVRELNKEMRATYGRDKVSIGFYAHGSAKPEYSGIGWMF